MSDKIENQLEKEIKACREEDKERQDSDADKIYGILRRLPFGTRQRLQCKIYAIPLTKPILKTYSDLVNENDFY